MSGTVPCPRCGQPNAVGRDFCRTCAESLATAASSVPPPAQVPAERGCEPTSPPRPPAPPEAVLRGNAGGRFRLAPGCTVGRGADVDLSNLPECEYISRLQARFHLEGTQWWLEALSTTAETRLNGRRLEPQRKERLGAGDTITFGGVVFYFGQRG